MILSISNGATLVETTTGVTLGRWNFRTNEGTLNDGRLYNCYQVWFNQVKRLKRKGTR